MNWVGYFAGLANQAAGLAHGVLNRMEARSEREDALSALEDAWESAWSDGVVDARERANLEKFFSEAGLGDAFESSFSSRLESGDMNVNEKADLEGDFRRRIRRERDQLHSEGMPDSARLDYLLTQYTDKLARASNASKTIHDAKSNVINNMIA